MKWITKQRENEAMRSAVGFTEDGGDIQVARSNGEGQGKRKARGETTNTTFGLWWGCISPSAVKSRNPTPLLG
jgi:hypothetical protein